MVLEVERTAASRPAVRPVAETLPPPPLASRPTSWLAFTSCRFRAETPPVSAPVATTRAWEPGPTPVVSALVPASMLCVVETWAAWMLTS